MKGKQIRLNKFISSSGFTSRRKADELIKAGRVTINGKLIIKVGVTIDIDIDDVRIDGEKIKEIKDYVYILLNKPRGYITSVSDEKNRPTVVGLVNIRERIYPIGRLDYDSEGLLLLTNDGGLANKLMHPRYGVEKTYEVRLNKPISDHALDKLRTGIEIDGKITSAKVKILPHSEKKRLSITIHEGRNRQVRRMLEYVGVYVRRLKRVKYGFLNLKGVASGRWRHLSKDEVKKLENGNGKNGDN